MLNEQKIKKMRKLATYESGKGRKQLRISKYYRSFLRQIIQHTY